MNMIRIYGNNKRWWIQKPEKSFEVPQPCPPSLLGRRLERRDLKKGRWIKTKAAIGSILRDRTFFQCLNGFEDISPLFPVSRCWLLKSCVQNIFNILRWYCAKCNFTGDWSRMGLKRNRPKFGSRHCPLGLTWSNHQENHHHQQISLASLQAITRRIINKKYLCQTPVIFNGSNTIIWYMV